MNGSRIGLSLWPLSISIKSSCNCSWASLAGPRTKLASWRFVVHVDLCTNRSGLDNSTHQSRPHNPFLKDRTNGRQQSGRTAQQGTTTTKKHNTEQQKTGRTKWQKGECVPMWGRWQNMHRIERSCHCRGAQISDIYHYRSASLCWCSVRCCR